MKLLAVLISPLAFPVAATLVLGLGIVLASVWANFRPQVKSEGV
jgi:ABC-type polysaccharide/polyol phosphate export permease